MYPVAEGFPQHSGSYIPHLYATSLLVEFYKATVFGAIASTEHEQKLKNFGDTLIIRTLPDIASRRYVKGQVLQYDTPKGGEIELLIDRGFYWGMKFNSVDKKQIDIDYINKWASHAATNQKVVIDREVLSEVYLGAHASNQGSEAGLISGNVDLGLAGSSSTHLALSASNIIQHIVRWGVVLDEQNVPDEGRWIVLPAWAIGLLKMSDIKNVYVTGDSTSPLRNGRVGEIDRFTIYQSNNLETVVDDGVACTNAIFGHKTAIAFASQMIETETLRNPNDFGDIMRSLQVFGFKVIKPEAMGHLFITPDLS